MNFLWSPAASLRTPGSFFYQETLMQTPGQGRLPYFPCEMSPRNAAAPRPAWAAPSPSPSCLCSHWFCQPSQMSVLSSVILPLGIHAWLLLPKCLDTGGKKNPRTLLIPSPYSLKRYFANVSTKIFLTAEERAAFAWRGSKKQFLRDYCEHEICIWS